MAVTEHISELMRAAEEIGRTVKIMEVCGTHTMAAFRTGLRSLLPDNVALISGPGCPVCVTPTSYIDHALAIAAEPGVIITTFGDMIRVPGSDMSLEHARARGADVRMVYSPQEALNLAVAEPDRRVVFLGVGFETTTPTIACTLKLAHEKGISNYSVLCAHKTIPNAMSALLADDNVQIDGFLCPGHVSVIIGAEAYEQVASAHSAPCVVAGFEADDMASGITMIIQQLLEGRGEVEIQYNRAVAMAGNTIAIRLCDEIFEECDTEWRGIGVIPASGLRIREKFSAHDAARVFSHIEAPEAVVKTGCVCGTVLRGACLPTDCGLYGRECTPMTPVGPCMVSSEGTCSAYYKYSKRNKD